MCGRKPSASRIGREGQLGALPAAATRGHCSHGFGHRQPCLQGSPWAQYSEKILGFLGQGWGWFQPSRELSRSGAGHTREGGIGQVPLVPSVPQLLLFPSEEQPWGALSLSLGSLALFFPS